jgi:hypothetical protein
LAFSLYSTTCDGNNILDAGKASDIALFISRFGSLSFIQSQSVICCMGVWRNETIVQMSSIGAFFRSMFTEWASALTGGLSIPLTLGAFYVSGHTQKLCFAGLAGLLGFYAAYEVFRKEHERALLAEAKVDNQNPKLSLQIDGATWEYNEEASETKIWLSLSVGNGGGPSIVKDWNGVYVTNSQELPMILMHVGEYGAKVVCGKRYLELNNSDLLQARTVETPIERRSQRTGKMLFTIPGNRTQELSELRSTLKISCRDFEGNPTTSIYKPTDPEGVVAFYHHEPVKEFTSPRVLFL